MLATYEEGLHEQFLERMRADATVLPSGSDEAGLTWTLRFTEASTLDAAWSEMPSVSGCSVIRVPSVPAQDHHPPPGDRWR